LALICFTKAFGIVFLGTPREKSVEEKIDEKPAKIFPLYLVALAISVIGIFPLLLSPFLIKAVGLYQPTVGTEVAFELEKIFGNLTTVGWYSLGFIVVTLLLYYLKNIITSGREIRVDETWGCGYEGETSKMQYTASSFIRTYRKLAEPFLSISRNKKEPFGLYPDILEHETHPNDKLENWLVNKPLHFIRGFLNRFGFLQNGNIQAYIFYGFIFIGLAILVPVIIDKIWLFINFINKI
jgi:NADH:ubiquinone oxidoreductase subunit 5 (subunit L)/multisubunit Na+/H+ antiporter MnhA subunit